LSAVAAAVTAWCACRHPAHAVTQRSSISDARTPSSSPPSNQGLFSRFSARYSVLFGVLSEIASCSASNIAKAT